jgi:hypothetical protein
VAFVAGAVTAGLLRPARQGSDGTVLFIPKGMAKQSDLKVGATVKARYQDRNGQKVATAIQVNPAAESGAGAGSK